MSASSNNRPDPYVKAKSWMPPSDSDVREVPSVDVNLTIDVILVPCLKQRRPQITRCQQGQPITSVDKGKKTYWPLFGSSDHSIDRMTRHIGCFASKVLALIYSTGENPVCQLSVCTGMIAIVNLRYIGLSPLHLFTVCSIFSFIFLFFFFLFIFIVILWILFFYRLLQSYLRTSSLRLIPSSLRNESSSSLLSSDVSSLSGLIFVVFLHSAGCLI